MRDPMPEVTRNLGRLVTQAYRATWRLREDEAKQKQVREILERAVKEIEEMVK
ncbi:MAG: hypothetical protein IH616_17285 [Gemmatimonadales bacterium]|nr:hypothetical protein [Gemmatimonadales bacterium]